MKYENTKSLTDLIDKIVLSEYESLTTELLQRKVQIQYKEKTEKDLRLQIEKLKNTIEEMSWNDEVIKKYERDTWKYYKAEPQYEYHWDEFWNWDIWICWIDVIEVTKEQKYPEPTPKQEQQQIESDEMPF